MSCKENIKDEIDMDVYNYVESIKKNNKELENKEKELFEKEKQLFEREKVLFEREKKIFELEKKCSNIINSAKSTELTTKISQLILLKSNKTYWEQNAFKDLLIEGDMDKLEWIKNNEGIIHFGTIYTAISHQNKEISRWFNNNYASYLTYEVFKWLLQFDINFNYGRSCHIYTNLTKKVLFWYLGMRVFNDIEKFILYILEYAIKCNNSLIIEWFEENIPEFEHKSEKMISENLPIISKYYEDGFHKYDGYGSLKDVYNHNWFKKYFGKYLQLDKYNNYCIRKI